MKMRGFVKLGFFILIASLFTVGFVSAVSEWAIGDEVQLIITTTNTGTVDVVESTGVITICSSGGLLYDAGSFNVEGVVAPGESVRVPVNWVSTGAAPGTYDIILDGELIYANGESESTHSVVEDAFLLYELITGLREVPEFTTKATVTGVTQITDTYYANGAFVIIVWINNTGSTLFIPEISTTFTGNDALWGPFSEFYIDSPSFPGLQPYMYACQLPEDMGAGSYTYSINVNMHYLDFTINDDTYPDGLEGFWKDYYTIIEPGNVEKAEEYNWEFQTGDSTAPILAFYDSGRMMMDEGCFATVELAPGLSFPFYKEEGIIGELTADEQTFFEDEVVPTYTENQLEALRCLPEKKEWDGGPIDGYSFTFESSKLRGIAKSGWYMAYYSADQEDDFTSVPIEIIVPTLSFNVSAWVNGDTIIVGEPFTINIKIDNTGGIAFSPGFTVNIVGDEDATITTTENLEDTENKVDIFTDSEFQFEFQIDDPTPPLLSVEIELTTIPIEFYEMTPWGIPNMVGTRYLVEELFDEEGGNTEDEQGAYDNLWEWQEMVYGPDFKSFTNNVMVHKAGVESGGTFIIVMREETEEDTILDIEPITPDTPSSSEGEGAQPQENEEEQPQGFSIQSLIQSILDFFRGLFG